MKIGVLLLVALLFPFVPAQAQDTLRMLTSEQFGALDAHLARQTAQFEAGKLSEREIIDAYKPFYTQQDVLSQHFRNWTRKHPGSFQAHLAFGIYLRKLGEHGRGTKRIGETPPDNLNVMSSRLDEARAELDKAWKLNGKSYLVAFNLLNAAQFDRSIPEARRHLDIANKLFPENFYARARYLVHLQPRWGGSYREMDEFIQEASRSGLSKQRLRWLQAIKESDFGATQRDSGASKEVYELHYIRALTLSADADPAFRAGYLVKAMPLCRKDSHRSQSYCG